MSVQCREEKWLGWGRSFLEDFMEEEALQLGLDGGWLGKGNLHSFIGGEYRGAEEDEMGGVIQSHR